MPRFEVYEPNKKQEEPTRFHLFQDKCGIALSIVDEHGFKQADVCRVRPDGVLYLCPDLPKRFGLKLDVDGCIVAE